MRVLSRAAKTIGLQAATLPSQSRAIGPTELSPSPSPGEPGEGVCRSKFRAFLCLAILLFAGCNSLPPGDVSAIHDKPALARHGQVILLRGWRGLYSTGIDSLADELRTQGVGATVFRESQWPKVAEKLANVYPSSTPANRPLVLIGFSYGADNAVAIARKLSAAGVNVDLLITIDPVTPDKVPIGVAECFNFYQSNGWMDVFPFFRGIPLQADSGSRIPIQNTNIHEHPELEDPHVGHRTIAAHQPVHQEIIKKVLEHCPIRSTTRPAASSPTN